VIHSNNHFRGKLKGLYMLFVLIILCSMLFNCSTKPKTGSIFGKVVLTNDTGTPSNDPDDFSGATVALYELADLDTTLVRINSRYPSTGVIINQQTDFDHRNTAPLVVATSDQDGSFSLHSIDPGTYNLVVMKEDWGIKYLHNISLSEGENKDISDLELYPSRSLNSSIIDDVVLETDHSYLIENDVSFIGSVTIDPGARIFVSPGCLIRFYGEVVTPSEKYNGEPWKILSGKSLYSTIPTSIGTHDFYSSVSFFEDTPVIRSGIIHHVSNAIAINGSQCEISDVILRYCGSGFMFSQGNMSLTNSIVAYGVDNETNFGVSVQGASGHSSISGNIFINMYEALIINTLGSFTINNCYFYDNYRGIYVRYNTGDISNNEFDMNFFDIAPGNSSIPQSITYNNFYFSGHTGIRPIGRVNINNNNFFITGQYYINIYSSELPNNSTVPEDLDAAHNYWAEADLDQYLYDALDNSEHPDTPCAYFIIYNPRRNSPVANAGIQ